MQNLKNYIGGILCEPVSGKYFENFCPSTGEVYSMVPDSDERDVEKAVTAANKVFATWSDLPAQKRSDYLMQIAEIIEKKSEMLAQAETRDNGKPLWLSRSVDIPRAVSNFRFFATAILHFSSESHSMENTALNYTLRVPVGIAGCISPWNLPLYLLTWKIAPALASGNCVIAKPSEITPFTAYLLSEICMEAGLPDGVLNIIHGYGKKAGMAICSHPNIPLISFTGGTSTGKVISETTAPMFKKLSLEMGGKNPNIIFNDCNFEKAIQTTIYSSFLNQGEICLCGSRILIEKDMYSKFKEELVEKTKQLKTGDPLVGDNKLGAIVSKMHLEKISSYIKLAQEEGGKILTGGNILEPEGRCKNGWYFEPTIIENLSFDCRVNQEEIFGPVVTLIPFENEEEAIKIANSTEYGLSASIWTENLSRAHTLASRIKSGIIWINCWLLRDLRTPFGGMKNSGHGREGGWESLQFFTEPKNVCIKF